MADIIEAIIQSDMDINDIDEYLLDHKIASISLFQIDETPYISLLFLNTKSNLIKDIIIEIFGSDVTYTNKNLKSKNWVLESQKNLSPISINGLIIHNDSYPKNKYKKIDITINESIAFGTGHHETTSGCAKGILYLHKYKNIKHILDIGTGTGLLAIIAVKLWKTNVLAIDNDPNAIAVTNLNSRLNQVSKYLNAKVCDILNTSNKITLKKKYDLVLINIYSNVINQIRFDICKSVKRGGFIILSGFNIFQQRSIISNYRCLGFVPVKKLVENNWVTLVLKRTK